jgi:hypothetical protein
MKKIEEKLNKVFESKIFSRSLKALEVLMIVIIIFSAGMITGFNKASFGNNWNKNYQENFGMGYSRGNITNMMKVNNGLFPNAHGTIGKIINIQLPNIIVQDKDGTEKVIVIDNDTGIEKIKDFIKVKDLQLDDFVVVVGSPNDQGQIEAKFIRVVPSPALLNNQ